MKNKEIKKERNRKWSGLYFLGLVIVLYIILFFLMGLLNYFLKPKTISRYMGKESGIKGWFFAVFAGILSHGPVYVWYPLLKDLRKHGMRTGLVAVFLYNRAMKIPLLPVMIFYFGIDFTIILSISVVIASIIEGKAIELLGDFIT